jgi:hypothetical protein
MSGTWIRFIGWSSPGVLDMMGAAALADRADRGVDIVCF